MHNQRQGVRSTKIYQAEQTNNSKRNEVKEKKQDIFIAVYHCKNTMYTAQTGKFPVRSSRVSVWSCCSSYRQQLNTHRNNQNNNRRRLNISPEYNTKTYERAQHSAQTPSLGKWNIQGLQRRDLSHRNDFPVSTARRPPPQHSRKSIHTWEYHFISIMSGTATTFPLHLRCQAIPQAERQLILLWKFNVKPVISAE